jgi:hypothetical protein
VFVELLALMPAALDAQVAYFVITSIVKSHDIQRRLLHTEYAKAKVLYVAQVFVVIIFLSFCLVSVRLSICIILSKFIYF